MSLSLSNRERETLLFFSFCNGGLLKASLQQMTSLSNKIFFSMRGIKKILSDLNSAPTKYIIKFSFQNFLRPSIFRPLQCGGREFGGPQFFCLLSQINSETSFRILGKFYITPAIPKFEFQNFSKKGQPQYLGILFMNLPAQNALLVICRLQIRCSST